jgi:hypothetical protein
MKGFSWDCVRRFSIFDLGDEEIEFKDESCFSKRLCFFRPQKHRATLSNTCMYYFFRSVRCTANAHSIATSAKVNNRLTKLQTFGSNSWWFADSIIQTQHMPRPTFLWFDSFALKLEKHSVDSKCVFCLFWSHHSERKLLQIQNRTCIAIYISSSLSTDQFLRWSIAAVNLRTEFMQVIGWLVNHLSTRILGSWHEPESWRRHHYKPLAEICPRKVFARCWSDAFSSDLDRLEDLPGINQKLRKYASRSAFWFFGHSMGGGVCAGRVMAVGSDIDSTTRKSVTFRFHFHLFRFFLVLLSLRFSNFTSARISSLSISLLFAFLFFNFSLSDFDFTSLTDSLVQFHFVLLISLCPPNLNSLCLLNFTLHSHFTACLHEFHPKFHFS